MVFNVPRLGPNGGFVHKETADLLCGDPDKRAEFQTKVAQLFAQHLAPERAKL